MRRLANLLFVEQQKKTPTASVLMCSFSEMVGQLLLSSKVLRGLFKLRSMRTCGISYFLLPTFKTCCLHDAAKILLFAFTRDTHHEGAWCRCHMFKLDFGRTRGIIYRALTTQGQACRRVFTGTRAEHQV